MLKRLYLTYKEGDDARDLLLLVQHLIHTNQTRKWNLLENEQFLQVSPLIFIGLVDPGIRVFARDARRLRSS